MPVQISSSLMQNHVAGIAPVPMKQLAVVCAADQSPILFAVDTKDRLSVTLRDPSQTTGWAQIPLSDQLAGIDGLGPAPLTQSFAVSQDSDGCIWLALTASAGDPAMPSNIYVSPKLGDDQTPDDWRQFGKMLLRRPIPAVAFTTMVLGGGDDGIGFPGIVVGTMRSNGQMDHYFVNPDPAVTTWTCLPWQMPTQTKACLAMAFGSVPVLGRGVYALCSTTDPAKDSLTFTTMPVVDDEGQSHTTLRSFDLPSYYVNTSRPALAALPVSEGTTELYLSGAGLQRYPLSLQTDDHLGQPIQIADKTFFVGTPQLSVSCDPAASTIDVWALNEYDQLAHTTGYLNTADADADAPASDDGPSYTWDPALTLATEITALAAYRAPVPQEDGAGRPGTAYPTQGAVAIAYRDHMALMLKSSASQLWQEQGVSLEKPDISFSLNTFTTQISVTDDDNIVLADTPVLIRPSFDVPALVNGKYYALRSGVAKEAVTDPTGMVTVVLETSDLAPPQYEITVADDKHDEDPAKNLVDELRTITTPEQIYNAERSDGGELFPTKTPGLMDQCTAAVKGIDGLLTAYDKLSATGARAGRAQPHGRRPGHPQQVAHREASRHEHEHGHEHEHEHASSYIIGCHFGVDGAVTIHKGQAALGALPAADDWEWIDSVGDALRAALYGVEKTISWTLEVGQSIIKFTIDLGSRVIAFVIDLVEQTLGVLNYVLQATLGIDLTSILAWLGFLFDWSDILATHKVLSKIVDLAFPYVISQGDTAKQWVHQAIEWARTSLLPIDESSPPYVGPARHTEPSPNPSMNSPQANWANRQFLVNAPATKYTAGTPSYDGNPFDDIDDAVVSSMYDIGNAVAQTFVDGFTTMDWSTAVTTLVNQIAGTFFDDVEYIVDLMIDALDTSLKNFQEIATGRWDIPVITWLYETSINPGGKLSLQDLGVLLAAIPATVTSKAVTGQNCFDQQTSAAILGAATWQDMIAAVVALPAAEADDDDNPGALNRAARQVMIAGALKSVGFICLAVSAVPDLSQTLQNAALMVKNIADWVAWSCGLENHEIVEEVRPQPGLLATGEGASRQELDSVVVILGSLPLLKDSFLVSQQVIHGVPSPAKTPLAYLEIGYGIVQLALAATVISKEWGEDPPPRTSLSDWHHMVGVKFGANLSGALTNILAFEETLPPGNELQLGLAIVRMATQAADVGCGIWLGGKGIELNQSDTGIG
jgi:hypothetical protein